MTNSQNDSAGQLGQIVSWRVPNTIPLSTLRQSLVLAGQDESLAGDLTPRRALSRALRSMSRETPRVIKRISSDTFQLNLTVRNGSDDHILYPHETDVAVMDGLVTSNDSEVEDQARRQYMAEMDRRQTGDLTRLVQRIFDRAKADLIPIREQGGAYFVPDSHRDLVDSVRCLLRDIGGNLRSYAVRLGCTETQQSVAESLTEYISGLIEEFRGTCFGVSEDSGQGVVQRRLAAAGLLRSKLECYRGLLMGYGDRIQAEIEAAEKELLERILGNGTNEETQDASYQD